jgi:hypothetical protein
MSTRPLQFRSIALCAAVLCGGCTGIDGVSSRSVIIPPEVINVSKSLSIPLEGVAAAAALYMIVDPLAPNWQIEETPLATDRYRIAMKKKRFTTGGDGEAAQVFYRRAAQIVREQGGARYRVVEFSEGVESSVPIAQRVAQGVVEVVR